jgi:hypothetical protein
MYTLATGGYLRKSTNLEYVNVGTAFSLEVWVRLQGHTDVVSYVACTSFTGQYLWYLILAASGSTYKLKFVVENAAGVIFSATHPTEIDTNWHHLAFAKLSPTTGALYVDSVAYNISSFGAATAFMQTMGGYRLYSGFNDKTQLPGGDFTISQLRMTLGFPYNPAGFTPQVDIRPQSLMNDILFLGSNFQDASTTPIASSTWAAEGTVTLGRRM